MSNESKPPHESKPKLEPMALRTVDDLTVAHEWLFNQQRAGSIDSKSADGMNTTLKGVTYLRAKLRLEAAKLAITAKIKKIDEDVKRLLPEGLESGS